MFNSFEDCLRVLLDDQGLVNTRGGSITKHGNKFQYRLFGQPEAIDGHLWFEIYPSSTPEVMWRVMPANDEARRDWEAFTANPDNGRWSGIATQ